MAEIHQSKNEDHGEAKKFSIPSREQVIIAIKESDESIEHISLNLIKCHFDATQNDVKKTFPEFQFVKIKKYNPGSFEVVFQLKIDAINFVKNSPGRKILNRLFMIKMGRNHKGNEQEWTYVQGAQETKKNKYYQNNNYKKPQPHQIQPNTTQADKKPAEQQKKQTTPPIIEVKQPQVKIQTKQPEVKSEPKQTKQFGKRKQIAQEKQVDQKPKAVQQVKEAKEIIKKQQKKLQLHTDYKPVGFNKGGVEVKAQQVKVDKLAQMAKKVEAEKAEKIAKYEAQKAQKLAEQKANQKPVQKLQQKPVSIPSVESKPAQKVNNTTETTKPVEVSKPVQVPKPVQIKPVEVAKTVQPQKAAETSKPIVVKKEEPADEDDGWIVVGPKPRNKKK